MIYLRSTLLCLLMLGRGAVAGSASHGGCDVHGPDDAAWFPGNLRTVNYCVQISEAFGRSDDAKLLVSEAIREWTKYTGRKIGDAPMATDYHPVDCSKSHELVFRLGGRPNPGSDDGLPRALGIAQRPSGNKPGTIWIRDPGPVKYHLRGGEPVWLNVTWENDSSLLSILMHEMGHVFGNPHINGTIMSEDIILRTFAHLLTKKRCAPAYTKTPSIDQERDLVPCVRCSHEGGTQVWSGLLLNSGKRHLSGIPASEPGHLDPIWFPAKFKTTWIKGQKPRIVFEFERNSRLMSLPVGARDYEKATVFPGQSVFRVFSASEIADQMKSIFLSSAGTQSAFITFQGYNSYDVQIDYNLLAAVKIKFKSTNVLGESPDFFHSTNPYACFSDVWPSYSAQSGLPLPGI